MEIDFEKKQYDDRRNVERERVCSNEIFSKSNYILFVMEIRTSRHASYVLELFLNNITARDRQMIPSINVTFALFWHKRSFYTRVRYILRWLCFLRIILYHDTHSYYFRRVVTH